MNHSLGEIEEAEIISEETIPLADRPWGEDGFLSWIARQADRLSEGNRGQLITNTLIWADYAKDSGRLREAYRQGEVEIDRYFDQVDIERIINDSGPRLEEKLGDLIKHNVPGLIAGTIIAAGSILAIKNYRNS
ncbi:hypothetical protein [Halalkalibaculum sp. DA384]|uniref:hypothetical protein n=1 Tax=Halalkalibaculum sp. DA384 TaxID=3373606 RepID=UPI003754EF71